MSSVIGIVLVVLLVHWGIRLCGDTRMFTREWRAHSAAKKAADEHKQRMIDDAS